MNKITEGVELGDLKRLVKPSLHIDEFKSKLGDDSDVIVLSFKVMGKDPAADLVSFIEHGYEFVLDADVSSGEMDDGDFIVFVELDRTPDALKDIIRLISDITNIASNSIDDWEFRYQKQTNYQEITLENLQSVVPSTPDAYRAKYEKDSDDELEQMKATAGIKSDKKAPDNEFTESLRIAAGIR